MMRIVIGLGNPGTEYEETRHNLGFKVVKKLCQQHKLTLKASSQAKGLFAQATVADEDVMFFLPLTFMNHSGVAVEKLIEKNAVDTKNILVVCDDFNLDFAKIRIRAKGSHGGHNGLLSIIESLNSDAFPRLRLGIGAPPGKKPASIFVLEEFRKKEKEILGSLIQDGADCCDVWIKDGMEKAMQQFNNKVVLS